MRASLVALLLSTGLALQLVYTVPCEGNCVEARDCHYDANASRILLGGRYFLLEFNPLTNASVSVLALDPVTGVRDFEFVQTITDNGLGTVFVSELYQRHVYACRWEGGSYTCPQLPLYTDDEIITMDVVQGTRQLWIITERRSIVFFDADTGLILSERLIDGDWSPSTFREMAQNGAMVVGSTFYWADNSGHVVRGSLAVNEETEQTTIEWDYTFVGCCRHRSMWAVEETNSLYVLTDVDIVFRADLNTLEVLQTFYISGGHNPWVMKRDVDFDVYFALSYTSDYNRAQVLRLNNNFEVVDAVASIGTHELRSMAMFNDNRNIFMASWSEAAVTMLDVGKCDSYSTCSDCATDEYCSWCFEDGTCKDTRDAMCASSSSTSCPAIQSVSPARIVSTGGTVTLAGSLFTDDPRMSCLVNGSITVMTFVSDTEVTCTIPATLDRALADKFADVPITLAFQGFSFDVPLVLAFYDCVSADSCERCRAPWRTSCRWCEWEGVCVSETSAGTCDGDFVLSECPRMSDNILPSRASEQQMVTVTGTNIFYNPSSAKFNEYECLFEIAGTTTVAMRSWATAISNTQLTCLSPNATETYWLTILFRNRTSFWKRASSNDFMGTARFFENTYRAGQPSFVREDKMVDYDFGLESFSDGFLTDRFSFMWTSYFNPPGPGEYRFCGRHDDGMRLYLGTDLCINYLSGGSHYTCCTRTIERSLFYDTASMLLSFWYYEDTGNSLARLEYQPTNDWASMFLMEEDYANHIEPPPTFAMATCSEITTYIDCVGTTGCGFCFSNGTTAARCEAESFDCPMEDWVIDSRGGAALTSHSPDALQVGSGSTISLIGRNFRGPLTCVWTYSPGYREDVPAVVVSPTEVHCGSPSFEYNLTGQPKFVRIDSGGWHQTNRQRCWDLGRDYAVISSAAELVEARAALPLGSTRNYYFGLWRNSGVAPWSWIDGSGDSGYRNWTGSQGNSFSATANTKACLTEASGAYFECGTGGNYERALCGPMKSHFIGPASLAIHTPADDIVLPSSLVVPVFDCGTTDNTCEACLAAPSVPGTGACGWCPESQSCRPSGECEELLSECPVMAIPSGVPSGDVRGGTEIIITGSVFISDTDLYTASFEGTVVPGTVLSSSTLRVLSPEWSRAELVSFEIIYDGQPYDTNAGVHQFVFYDCAEEVTCGECFASSQLLKSECGWCTLTATCVSGNNGACATPLFQPGGRGSLAQACANVSHYRSKPLLEAGGNSTVLFAVTNFYAIDGASIGDYECLFDNGDRASVTVQPQPDSSLGDVLMSCVATPHASTPNGTMGILFRGMPFGEAIELYYYNCSEELKCRGCMSELHPECGWCRFAEKCTHLRDCPGGANLTCDITTDIELVFIDEEKKVNVVGVLIGVMLILCCFLVVALLLLWLFFKKQRQELIQNKVPELTAKKIEKIVFGKDLEDAKTFVKEDDFPTIMLRLSTIKEFLRADATGDIGPDGSEPFFALQCICETVPAASGDMLAKCLVYLYEDLGLAEEMISARITQEMTACQSVNTLFRTNSMSTKLFRSYSKLKGITYLHSTLSLVINEALVDAKNVELDASRMDEGGDEQLNRWTLMVSTQKISNAIFQSHENIPPTLRRIFKHVQEEFVRHFSTERGFDAARLIQDDIKERVDTCYGQYQLCLEDFARLHTGEEQHQVDALKALLENFDQVKAEVEELDKLGTSLEAIADPESQAAKQFALDEERRNNSIAVGGFFYLRFVVPSITAPEHFGLVKEGPEPSGRRLLVLISKVMQNLSNGVFFGKKEPFMMKMNTFIVDNLDRVHSFFAKIKTNIPDESTASDIPADVMWLALKNIHNEVAGLRAGVIACMEADEMHLHARPPPPPPTGATEGTGGEAEATGVELGSVGMHERAFVPEVLKEFMAAVPPVGGACIPDTASLS